MGAEVRLYDAAGKIIATRQVSTGEGYNSQGTQPLHFGLASTAPVTVEVTCMTAADRRAQRVRSVRAGSYSGRTLIVTEK